MSRRGRKWCEPRVDRRKFRADRRHRPTRRFSRAFGKDNPRFVHATRDGTDGAGFRRRDGAREIGPFENYDGMYKGVGSSLPLEALSF